MAPREASWRPSGVVWMLDRPSPASRSFILAAALIAPAAAFVACGDSDHAAPSAAVKAATPAADSAPVTPTTPVTLASRLQGVVSAPRRPA